MNRLIDAPSDSTPQILDLRRTPPLDQSLIAFELHQRTPSVIEDEPKYLERYSLILQIFRPHQISQGNNPQVFLCSHELFLSLFTLWLQGPIF